MKIDETNIDTVRQRQRIRDIMRGHGLTEIIDGAYSDGTIRNGQMAVVRVHVKAGASEAEITAACNSAAQAFLDQIRTSTDQG